MDVGVVVIMGRGVQVGGSVAGPQSMVGVGWVSRETQLEVIVINRKRQTQIFFIKGVCVIERSYWEYSITRIHLTYMRLELID